MSKADFKTTGQVLDFPRGTHGSVTLPPGCIVEVTMETEFATIQGEHKAVPVTRYTARMPRVFERPGFIGKLYRAFVTDLAWADANRARPDGDVYLNGRLVGATRIATVCGIGFCWHDLFDANGKIIIDHKRSRPVNRRSIGFVSFIPRITNSSGKQTLPNPSTVV